MTNKQVKVGTRGSQLALLQTQSVLERFSALFPGLILEVVRVETLGDRDLITDLRESPADFFTRDLDEALRQGQIDLAIHSAKDLPDPMPEDLDWCWLPWREDPRDAWVLPAGNTFSDLPDVPVIGVSSERRETCARSRFPQAILKPIRGTIAARLKQLDAGDYDAIIMAGAALNRLSLSDRVTEWLSVSELPVPAGQGVLAISFRLGDPLWTRLRSWFVKSVRFVGAGVGSADFCTWGGVRDLQKADVCLYDVLMDDHLLTFLSSQAERVFVGKRCGEHALRQPDITGLIARYARQGRRVVRLKGGDPGLFGRLAEETDELDRLALPYRVRAGVSALTVATTGTGLMLTKRGVSRGFTVLTPRAEGGAVEGVSLEVRRNLPIVLFMSIRVASQMAAQLLAEGWSETMPAAAVFNAGADDEEVFRMTLADLRDGAAAKVGSDAPGLLVIGEVAAGAFRRDTGALAGCRVLLTCSEALLEKAALRVIDFGGVPLLRPLIRLTPCAEVRDVIERVASYDWLVLTSPSAVHFFMKLVREAEIDLRTLPQVMACGAGSAAAFREYGLHANLTPPMNYSAIGLAEEMRMIDLVGQRVLRLRSEKAGPLLANVLREQGAQVEDVQLYKNEAIRDAYLPACDAIFFASASAVEAFVAQFGADALSGKSVLTIGKPTSDALAKCGRRPDVVADEATVDGAIETLARYWLGR